MRRSQNDMQQQNVLEENCLNDPGECKIVKEIATKKVKKIQSITFIVKIVKLLDGFINTFTFFGEIENLTLFRTF